MNGLAMTPGAPDERLLWVYGGVLLRHRRWLVGLPVGLGLFFGVLTFNRPRQYTGRASFIPVEASSPQAGISALVSQFGIGPTAASGNSPDFYVELLQSAVLQREVLTMRYRLSSGDSATLLRVMQITPDTGAKALSDGLRALRGVTSIDADRLTGVVHLEVYTKDRDLSSQVARRFLDLVNEFNLRRRQLRGHTEAEFMGERVAEAQRVLQEGEESLADFYRRNRRYQDSPALVAEEGRLQRVIGLRQQLYLSLSQSLQVARLQEVRNTPVIAVIEEPEGFVEARPRGTIRNLVLGALAGLIMAVGLAFALEYLAESQRSGSSDYQVFKELWGQATAGLRRLILRRPGTNR
jgi:uncharacterized protein involved in exopolysaccharide biosynthesis